MKEGFISTLQSYSTKDGPGMSSASDVTCAAHGVQTQSLCSPVKNTCILNNAVSGAVPASNTAMVKYPWQKMDA